MTTRKIGPPGGPGTLSTPSGGLSRTIDLRGFLSLLERVTSGGRMEHVRAMMRLDRFLLWHEITPEHVTGIIQSGGDAAARHACRIDKDGRYMCCSHGLEPCAGLADGLCEHLGGLLLALVQFGLADARVISDWAKLTVGHPPDLDLDAMRDVLAQADAAA